jgi:hypothetical protein
MSREEFMAERLPFFLEHARQWRAAADALRACGVPEGDPALTVWREAAYCHLLLIKGLHRAAVKRLREVLGAVANERLITAAPPGCEADALSVAAELFALIRSAVSARHPAAFGRHVAA